MRFASLVIIAMLTQTVATAQDFALRYEFPTSQAFTYRHVFSQHDPDNDDNFVWRWLARVSIDSIDGHGNAAVTLTVLDDTLERENAEPALPAGIHVRRPKRQSVVTAKVDQHGKLFDGRIVKPSEELVAMRSSDARIIFDQADSARAARELRYWIVSLPDAPSKIRSGSVWTTTTFDTTTFAQQSAESRTPQLVRAIDSTVSTHRVVGFRSAMNRPSIKLVTTSTTTSSGPAGKHMWTMVEEIFLDAQSRMLITRTATVLGHGPGGLAFVQKYDVSLVE